MFHLGELPKFTEDKWLRSRSNRGSFGMIAAAVAQVVVGNSNIPPEASGTTLIGSNNQVNQNSVVINYQNERRCSGPEVVSAIPDNNTINNMNDNDTIGNENTPGSQSESTCNLNHNNIGDALPNKNVFNDHPSASRFISDGISQLTMGSFQVISISLNNLFSKEMESS